ncbi:MAG TPA: citrate/2-methylcitrate synthase [Streptosporangiaceae bacterium]|jgi:citrate synthase
MGEPIDARTAARWLGVDVRTLYAYVSRGALRRVPGPDGRSSRYDSDELELLARRSRPRTLPRPPASIDLVIATRVSLISDGAVRYRGTDVLDLVAAGEPFEAVAGLLWSGRLERAGKSWTLTAGQAGVVQRMAQALDDAAPAAARFAAVAAALAEDANPAVPPDWAGWGRTIVAAFIETCAPGTAGSVAERLWQGFSPLRPTAARVRALGTALVLLAEHELAVSTLAVRVAASARAAPPGCVLAGLGALSGALHGDMPRLVRERLRGQPGGDWDSWPGFGHSVHTRGDPRAAPLLRAVERIAAPGDRDLINRVTRAAPAPPNSDFALAALCHVARMPAQAPTALFAVARTAGWIAHAAEEYGEPQLRFRGRAVAPGRRPR